MYGSSSIVYVISSSLLLLNADLHIAELLSSKIQFVHNTWTAIQDQIQAPETLKSPASGTCSSRAGDLLKSSIGLEDGPERIGQDQSRSHLHTTGELIPELALDGEDRRLREVASTPGWDSVMKMLLEGIYNSIRNQPLMAPRTRKPSLYSIGGNPMLSSSLSFANSVGKGVQ